MEKDKAIDVLNALITINNDRIEGYETAMKETEEEDLISLFTEFIENSKECKAELEAEVINLGGTPAEGTKTTGKFFRAWMDVKAALAANDRKTVLSSCEFGEDHAVEEYEKALKHSEDLSAEQLLMINGQYAVIKADHNMVRNMRDALKVAS